MNNTYKHISDESTYSVFNPTGTLFPESVKNVQDALALTAPTQQASTSVVGVVQLATVDEVNAGINNTKAVTPYTLNQRLQYPDASTTVKGIVYLASNDEAKTGTDSAKSIVPSTLKYTLDWYWNNRTSTETNYGTIKLSTQQAASSGTDDTTAMTPLKVQQAIAAATSMIPSYTQASESNPGLVQLATIGQAQQGELRNGYAISPYTLSRMTGSLTSKGVVQAATQAQANVGNDDSLYISAKGFKTYTASQNNVGTVQLSVTRKSGSGLALSADANVLATDSQGNQSVSGNVNFTGTIQAKGSNIASEKYVQNQMPIGSTIMYMGNNAPDGGVWALCDGGQESRANRPDLFAVIGYRFGGSGDVFYRPDMRGLFARGAGVSSHILNQRGVDSKGKDRLGVGVSGGRVGEVQMQQQRKHKHALGDGDINRDWFVYGASLKRGYGGGRNRLWDNAQEFTNDGTEIESANVRDSHGTLNTEGFIGDENRPWNMSVNYIIKVSQ